MYLGLRLGFVRALIWSLFYGFMETVDLLYFQGKLNLEFESGQDCYVWTVFELQWVYVFDCHEILPNCSWLQLMSFHHMIQWNILDLEWIGGCINQSSESHRNGSSKAIRSNLETIHCIFHLGQMASWQSPMDLDTMMGCVLGIYENSAPFDVISIHPI